MKNHPHIAVSRIRRYTRNLITDRDVDQVEIFFVKRMRVKITKKMGESEFPSDRGITGEPYDILSEVLP